MTFVFPWETFEWVSVVWCLVSGVCVCVVGRLVPSLLCDKSEVESVHGRLSPFVPVGHNLHTTIYIDTLKRACCVKRVVFVFMGGLKRGGFDDTLHKQWRATLLNGQWAADVTKWQRNRNKSRRLPHAQYTKPLVPNRPLCKSR